MSASASASQSPSVSICIPAYNAGRHIAETLENVRAQTFASWELLVIEDAAPDSGADNTGEIVRAFAASVAQPVLFQRNATNLGPSATRNALIARARGEWIAFLDADDLWTPWHLALALKCAASTGADFVHTGVTLFDGDTGAEIASRPAPPRERAALERALFTGDLLIQPSAALIRQKLLARAGGFDPALRYAEDRELWMRLARAGARIEFLDTITCRYRQHAAAATRNAAAVSAGLAQALERHAGWPAIPRALSRQRIAAAWLAAGRLTLRTDPRRARQYLARSLRRQPANPRALTCWCAALLLGITRRPAGGPAASTGKILA